MRGDPSVLLTDSMRKEIWIKHILRINCLLTALDHLKTNRLHSGRHRRRRVHLQNDFKGERRKDLRTG